MENSSSDDELKELMIKYLTNKIETGDRLDNEGESDKIVDPSSPRSVRFQKWAMLSIALALLGLGAEIAAIALSGQELTYRAIFGKGELYMVSIGMLFSAAGELLYDRTRLGPEGAWQISLSLAAFLFHCSPP